MLRVGLIVGVVVFVAIQLVPYGRDHDNPPVTEAPEWDSARTEQLAIDACYDCHSNETEWPWYSNIAPMSRLMQRDVNASRAELNFSEGDREQDELKDLAETIVDGEMPRGATSTRTPPRGCRMRRSAPSSRAWWRPLGTRSKPTRGRRAGGYSLGPSIHPPSCPGGQKGHSSKATHSPWSLKRRIQTSVYSMEIGSS